MNEADRLDLSAILEESLANAMHSIHDAAIVGKNDGEGKIAVEHQPRMIDDLTAGHSSAFIVPVRLVELTNRGQWNPLAN
jgi:hypothetical protein